jgi:ASCH domain
LLENRCAPATGLFPLMEQIYDNPSGKSLGDPVTAMRGLIIAEPWISKILSGEKTWEMRSGNTKMRGLIGLIRSRSLHVVGVAHVVDSRGPFSIAELGEHFDFHRVPESVFEQKPKWNKAWVLRGVVALPRAVRYVHLSGAQTWVKLSEQVEEAIRAQLPMGMVS